MKDIRQLVREGLMNYIQEAEGQKTKKQEIPLPQGCFKGPKMELGALVSLVQLLSHEGEKGKLAIDDLKQFMKGSKKINPEHVAGILRKHDQTQLIHWVGCM